MDEAKVLATAKRIWGDKKFTKIKVFEQEFILPFSAAIADAEREKLRQLRKDMDSLSASLVYEKHKIIQAAVAAEREECAKVAENGLIGHTIAQAIRARGEK